MANEVLIGAIDLIIYVILGFVVFGLVLSVTMLIYFRGKYKHFFVRKILTGDKPVKIIDKAREVYDKDTGVYYWKLLKAKHLIGRPPSEAIHVTEKGNYYVEAYYLGDLNYIYGKENITPDLKAKIKQIGDETRKEFKFSLLDTIRRKYFEIARQKLLRLILYKPRPIYVFSSDFKNFDDLKKDNPTINTYKPITTNQRLIAYGQIKKAYEKKSTGLMQLAYMAIPIVAMIILISIIFIFGGEIIKPLASLGGELASTVEKANEITKSQSDITQMLAAIIQERQYITSQVGGTVGQLNRTPPD